MRSISRRTETSSHHLGSIHGIGECLMSRRRHKCRDHHSGLSLHCHADAGEWSVVADGYARQEGAARG